MIHILSFAPGNAVMHPDPAILAIALFVLIPVTIWGLMVMHDHLHFEWHLPRWAD